MQLFFLVIIASGLLAPSLAALSLVRDLIQFNVAGHPVLHKPVEYHFDPDVGVRRSRQYQELNGRFGERAIERLGLGVDGFDHERLEAQQARDAGLVNQAFER